MHLKRKKAFIASFLLVLIALCFYQFYSEEQAFYKVSYPKEDISSLIQKEELSTDDFMTIYNQTGVSPYAARELIENKDYETLEKLNVLYFEEPDISKNFIAYPTTLEERNSSQNTPFVNLKKGDILITFNSSTLDWRHGHCGLVLDEVEGKLLEHTSIGNVSCITNLSDWASYPGFVILRPEDENVAEKAVSYAEKTLVGIPYNLFSGLINKETSRDSHCSHIVWRAYKEAGLDIDSSKGMIVTPKDIAMSENLDVVQIFGINPKTYKDRIKM